MDLANARSRVSSASNPVRNGNQFWRGTLQRFGSEFDDNSDNHPFAPYTEVIDAIGDIFERRTWGNTKDSELSANIAVARFGGCLFKSVSITALSSQMTESTTW
jgi:hypothetical protein